MECLTELKQRLSLLSAAAFKLKPSSSDLKNFYLLKIGSMMREVFAPPR